jgi:hypothetical protein
MTTLNQPGMDWYCRTCRRALSTVTALGPPMLVHAAERRGDTVDHPAEPIPLVDLADPIIECDFCSGSGAAWVFRCKRADQDTQLRCVVNRVVRLRDDRRHHAARTVRVDTEEGLTQRWGQTWSTCPGCAEVIERRDLYGLTARVVEAMPPTMRRGNSLVRLRGELHGMFTTLVPGRGRITPGHRLGVWDEPTTN